MPSGIYKRKFKWNKIFTKKFLNKEYVLEGKSTYTIAKKIGCHPDTVRNNLKKFDILVYKISQEGRKKKSKSMQKNRKNGIIKTWNKNKSLWKERPELVLQMKKTLKNKHLNVDYEFKKGHTFSKKGKNSRKTWICKHHKDLDKQNNHPKNLLYLNFSNHARLHRKCYNYLLNTNQLKKYMNWFIKNYNIQLYSEKDYKERKNG